MLAICDGETGNYLSERSFWSEDGERWELYEFTGRLETSFYSNQQTANTALKQLQVYNQKSRLNRKLYIKEVNLNDLPIGKTIRIL